MNLSNGNQTMCVIGVDASLIAYDADNRLAEVRKNSVSMATFVYDGDERRVKSTINGTTTTFVGAHHSIPVGDEVTGSTFTKYYFAGASRIAMHKYAHLSLQNSHFRKPPYRKAA